VAIGRIETWRIGPETFFKLRAWNLMDERMASILAS
jgi:hypothetical protein